MAFLLLITTFLPFSFVKEDLVHKSVHVTISLIRRCLLFSVQVCRVSPTLANWGALFNRGVFSCSSWPSRRTQNSPVPSFCTPHYDSLRCASRIQTVCEDQPHPNAPNRERKPTISTNSELERVESEKKASTNEVFGHRASLSFGLSAPFGLHTLNASTRSRCYQTPL